MKSIVLIVVEGGLIQSIAVSLDLARDIQVIVQDYDCESQANHSQIQQDCSGDLCEIQRWKEKDFAILDERDREYLKIMTDNSS